MAATLLMMIINISLFLSLFIFSNAASAASAAAGLKNGIINVANMGAKADGKTDARTAFLKAWTTACNSLQPTTIYVPKKKYLLGEIVFKGPCKNTKGITFKIDGILIAPDFKKMGSSSENWIKFDQVQRVTVLGGFLDGRGSSLWNCKLGKKQGCPAGASSLAFYSSRNIAVHNLKSVNAKLYHVVVHSCTNVILEKIMISAPENSPNTDGIHVQNSFNVRVLNTGIKTGDDCISIGPGTKSLWIERVACGPGHGISIGSLAKESKEEGVENVMVKNVVFTGTQNGLRIKAWARPSNGYVRGVVFKQAVMKNVQNPIVIDQNYCPRNEGCPGQHSGIQISQVTFANIKGTSATQVAMRFDCSKTSPCTGINVEDIKLTHKNMQAQAFCQNARGITRGQVSPPSCL